jgi:hypothetical protein
VELQTFNEVSRQQLQRWLEKGWKTKISMDGQTD